MVLSNAFSLQMLTSFPAHIDVQEIEVTGDFLDTCTSAIGHADLCMLINGMFGSHVEPNRTTNRLKHGESIIVAQYVGGRLPEGATTLPEGAAIKFLKVTVTY